MQVETKSAAQNIVAEQPGFLGLCNGRIAPTAAALEMQRIMAALFAQRHARLQPALGAERRQRFIDLHRYARAETCDRLQREDAVVRCLVLAGQTQMGPDGVIDRLGFPDMTCRTVADLDDVLAFGLEREVLEEGRHTVRLGDRDAKLARDQLQIALAEIALLRLNILKDRDQRGLAAPMVVNDLHDLCALRFVHFPVSPLILRIFRIGSRR